MMMAVTPRCICVKKFDYEKSSNAKKVRKDKKEFGANVKKF